MAVKQYPSIEYLRQCLRHEDGKLFWLVRPREHFATLRGCNIFNAKYSEKEAGSVNKILNRHVVGLNGILFYRYHIVWAIHHGEWKIGLDHENRNSLDDRIGNLRPATKTQNGWNRGLMSTNTSGVKGVSWSEAAHKWQATIRINGRSIGLGYYSDIEDARQAYEEAASKYQGEFAYHRGQMIGERVPV